MKYLALTTLNKIEKPIIKIRSNNELSLKKRSSKMYRDSKDLSVLSGFSSRIRRSDVTRKGEICQLELFLPADPVCGRKWIQIGHINEWLLIHESPLANHCQPVC
jgi:hypothetical protein